MENLKFPRPVGVSVDEPVSRTTGVLRVPGAHTRAVDYYAKQLEAAGFTCMLERMLPSGKYYVYGNGEVRLSFSRLTSREEMRVFYEKMPPVTDYSKAGEKKYPNVTLTQFCTGTSVAMVCSTASGMGYVIRLRDGRLIVIDGGFHCPPYDNDYEGFKELLWSLSDGKKPQIAAWVITHVHVDHYGVLLNWKEEDADIQAYWSTLPKEGISDGGCRHMETRIPHYTEKNVVLHTGDHYVFDDEVSVDVLYTVEEMALYNPERQAGENDQSVIFRVNIGDQKVLFVGDAAKTAFDLALEMAGGEVKSDICQVGHHGRFGHKEDLFYSFVAPTVALWPACYAQLDNDLKVRYSGAWLRGEISTVVDHYVANDGTETLTFPYELQGKSYHSPLWDLNDSDKK